jgi:hypothetical protein
MGKFGLSVVFCFSTFVVRGLNDCGCFEVCPDGVTAVSAGGSPCGWNLGIPWSHPVATWASEALVLGPVGPLCRYDDAVTRRRRRPMETGERGQDWSVLFFMRR